MYMPPSNFRMFPYPKRPSQYYESPHNEDHHKLLPNEPPDEELDIILPRRTARRRYILYLLLFTCAIGIISALGQSWKRRLTTSWVSCGSSPAEARAANCHYEPMLRAWVPDACYFPEPGDEYDPFEDRKWFQDKNLTQEIVGKEKEKLRAGDTQLAFTHEFHTEHCVYVWRKVTIAARRQLSLVDSRTGSFDHWNHCSTSIEAMIQMVSNGTWDVSDIVSGSPLKYIGCVEFSWR